MSRIAPTIELNLSPEEDKTCRVCFETGTVSMKLISPCKCTGSVKYIHEECMKTWIVSQYEDIEEVKCEICKTPLLMEFKIGRKCSPKMSCQEGVSQCMFIPLLFSVLAMLGLIIYLLADTYLEEAADNEERGYTIALLVTCIISSIVVIALMAHAFKESCFTFEINNWFIYSQEFSFEEVESQKSIKEENYLSREPQNQPVLVIPNFSRVGGRKVTVPNLRPNLTPVMQRERIIAFTPNITPQLSLISYNREVFGTPSEQEQNAS